MNKLYFIGWLSFFSTPSLASECPIVAEDMRTEIMKLQEVQSIQLSQFKDIYSDEPVLNYTISMKSGDVWLAQQKHCQMHNLVVNGLIVHENTQTKEMVSTLTELVTIFPTWNLGLGKASKLETPLLTSIEKQKDQSGPRPLDQSISSTSINSEVLFESIDTEDQLSPIKHSLSLSISVGGMP